MKKLLPYCLVLCGIVMFATLHSAGQSNTGNNPINTGLTADSGYITVQNLRATFVIQPGDTLFKPSEYYKPTDTIGKYYKMANGNYIASVATMNRLDYETIILCEATKTGKVLKAEEYYFGNYACCWDNASDYLKKSGDYYVFTSCGTGSAFCGGDIFIFKEVKPQDWKELIPKSIWMWAGPDMPYHYISITSTMEIVNNSVIMHYTNELYEQPEDSKIKTTKEIEKFDITWLSQNGNWMVTDSVKLKEVLQYR